MSEVLPASMRASFAIRDRMRSLGVDGVAEGGAVDSTIQRLLDCLEQSGIEWCLVGAHAVGHYTEPRATADVDLVVDDQRLPVLLARLREVFGDLGEVDTGAALRLSTLAVDLIRASSGVLFRQAIARSELVGGVRIPRREVLVALKFLSAVSHFRSRERKAQHVVDLMRLVTSVDAEALDRELILELAAHAYPGAEREMADVLRRIDAGEPLSI